MLSSSLRPFQGRAKSFSYRGRCPGYSLSPFQRQTKAEEPSTYRQTKFEIRNLKFEISLVTGAKLPSRDLVRTATGTARDAGSVDPTRVLPGSHRIAAGIGDKRDL
jgi:hypothetical protein